MKELDMRPLRRRMAALAAALAAVLALGLNAAPPTQAASAAGQRILIPGGKALGIAMETKGVILVGTSDIGKQESPARQAGLKPGDVICAVDGQEVSGAEELSALLEAGRTAELTVQREDAQKHISVTPAQDPADGQARIGAWVRGGTAGVGTLTFIDPQSGVYGALGHPISDADTGVCMPLKEGAIYDSTIVGVHRGEKGAPGELVGDFLGDERQIGSVTRNDESGIYGLYTAADTGELPYPGGLPVAGREEVHAGEARILSTLDDEIRAYDVEIEHVDAGEDKRSIVLHVTDGELLARTGGIVQGMSGSPILQDGKLVGAVTHVLVNDPTRGYGIFIENMLDAAS